MYITNDYGKHWELAIDGLPIDDPVRVVREDPQRKGLLYAGTEFGFYISFNGGKHWESFQQNLPIVPVTDINFMRSSLAISTLGRSFWVLDDRTPLHNLHDQEESFKLLTPKDPIIQDVLDICFILPLSSEQKGDLTFTFKKGTSIVHQKKVPISKMPTGYHGIRKTEWDLKHYLPFGKKDFTGPWVSPGLYTVEIKYGMKKESKNFQVNIPPDFLAIGTTEQDLKEQEEIALKVAQLVINISNEVKRLEESINKAKKEEDKAYLQQLYAQLKKGPRRYDQPKLLEHAKYLYEMLTETPQKPGQDAYSRYDSLEQAFEGYLKNK